MYYDYIQISKINDFLFCPWSLYFHSVYETFAQNTYKASPQIAGSIAHESVDQEKFSTRKNILQGREIFSQKYGIIGKIDIYDKDKCELVERKRKVKEIYDGYVFQLYAQKLCLEEMGFEVKTMKLYSITDNKTYIVTLTQKQKTKFKKVLKDMRSFNLTSKKCSNHNKCKNCIYRELCKIDV